MHHRLKPRKVYYSLMLSVSKSGGGSGPHSLCSFWRLQAKESFPTSYKLKKKNALTLFLDDTHLFCLYSMIFTNAIHMVKNKFHSMGKPNLTLCPEEEQELNTCGQHILVMTIGQKEWMEPICEKVHGLEKKKIAHLWSTQCPRQDWGQ